MCFDLGKEIHPRLYTFGQVGVPREWGARHTLPAYGLFAPGLPVKAELKPSPAGRGTLSLSICPFLTGR
jgi:hypothetical protein